MQLECAFKKYLGLNPLKIPNPFNLVFFGGRLYFPMGTTDPYAEGKTVNCKTVLFEIPRLKHIICHHLEVALIKSLKALEMI